MRTLNTLKTRLRALQARNKGEAEGPHLREVARGLEFVSLGRQGKLTLEAPVGFHRAIRFKKSTSIGAFTYFNNGFIDNLAKVGRYCSIGQDVRIGEPNHPVDWLSTSNFQYNRNEFAWHEALNGFQPVSPKIRGSHFAGDKVLIGNDVWIGARVTILRNVRIGDGAIVAAGAVVTKDVEPFTVVGGVPAKTIGKRFADDLCARISELRWWRFAPSQLTGLQFHDVNVALDELSVRVEGGLEPYEPGTVTWASITSH